ncbi:MAG: PAS domain-containing sensor histidine kinase [bacterium]|nr:PAS domain-containing sensor histidine kinase [bacterium]
MSKGKQEKNNYAHLRGKTKQKRPTLIPTGDQQFAVRAKRPLISHKKEAKIAGEMPLKAETKLWLTNDEYAQLFDRAPVGYFILDRNGVISNVNFTGCTQLGNSKNKLIGQSLSKFLSSSEQQENFKNQSALLHKAARALHFEGEMIRVDGSKFSALIESNVVADTKNKFKHLLCTLSDITEQKVQEHLLELALLREKELNHLKSQFVTIASHEFRTPLSTIMTSAELMEKYSGPGDDEKKKKHLHKISNAVSRLKEILIDFLSVEEVEKGTVKNSPQTFDLVEFTENLIEEIRSFNGTHYVNYKHVGRFRNVFLDQKLLRTVLSNLLINAYKYSPKGGNIEVVTEQKKVGTLLIYLKDQGIGIPKADESHIFEQFFRAKNAEKIQGTGLGLHIVKKLVNIMGGGVSFQSEEQKGSTFYITF